MAYSHRYLQILIFPLILGASVASSATEPLFDQLAVDGLSGPLFPEKCCWVGLPETEKFRAAMREEMKGYCSAIGGIVGRFRLEDGKLWLEGMHRCGGNIPLQEIYPELDNPALATWVSGNFTAKLGLLCWVNNSDERVYRTTLKLKIKDGVVTDIQREEGDETACKRTP
jgi:hypothetical protein